MLLLRAVLTATAVAALHGSRVPTPSLHQGQPSVNCASVANWANETAYVGPSLKVLPGSSFTSCCEACVSFKSPQCAYFTFYSGNASCALKAVFGEPKAFAGATSGMTANGPAPADYAHHDDPALLSDLRALPPLPKPHYSWPVMPTSTIPEYVAGHAHL